MLYFLHRNVVLTVAQQRCNKIVVFKIQSTALNEDASVWPPDLSQTRKEDFVTWPKLVPCFSPPMLHPLTGDGEAASGTWNSDASLHPRHDRVQEGLLLLLPLPLLLVLPAVLSFEVDRWSSADPQLPASSGPTPPQTAGMVCGEALLPTPPLSPLFLKSWSSKPEINPRRRNPVKCKTATEVRRSAWNPRGSNSSSSFPPGQGLLGPEVM